MNSYKICLMGAFSVGKSSLVRRFVHKVFDDRYITTLGVTIETREIELDAGHVKLVIWDMEGTDSDDQDEELVTSRMRAYLQGVNGIILVADGTRPVTVRTARRLHDWLDSEQPGMPAVMLLNKADLTDNWRPDMGELSKISRSLHCFSTSALSGVNVENAFRYLAGKLGETQ